jgi:MarR family transcriptional regulator for hemolysin
MDRLRNFGFLLSETTRRYVLRFEQRARAISLTLPQCKVLVRLETDKGVSQTKLAEFVGVEPMTMVRILDRMEADGLVERRPDPEDRRARRLYLTRKAKPVLDRIWHLAELTRAETFAGISRQEREDFIGVLERVYSNVCALQGKAIEVPDGMEATQATAKSGNGVSRSRRP